MTLTGEEFLRRFLQHVLPKGFPRIRYFGWLANRRRQELLPRCRALLSQPLRATPADPPEDPAQWQCPRCRGLMHVVERLTAAQILFVEIREVCILDSS
jgi:Putative transposase